MAHRGHELVHGSREEDKVQHIWSWNKTKQDSAREHGENQRQTFVNSAREDRETWSQAFVNSARKHHENQRQTFADTQTHTTNFSSGWPAAAAEFQEGT